jgi:hypothetical protein
MPLDPRLIRPADARQLYLPRNEIIRLENRVRQDVYAALSDHTARMERFTRYYRAWRNRTEPGRLGDERKSNYRVPLTQWHVFTKWAKEHAALFGEDAEVTAKPVGPEDQRNERKISRFATWALFDLMKIPNKAQIFDFRKILFGRSHAYCPWGRETYRVPLIDGSMGDDLAYEGPLFDPLWPDDFIVPAEDVENLHKFSWVVRKYRATPDELLRGEEDGRYQQIEDHFDDIVNFCSHKRARDYESETIKKEKDLAEGVTYEGNLSAANALIVHEWYGRWRKLKSRRDAREDNLQGRERYESDLVVRYLPDLNLVIGVQDLAEMYPRKVNRRPFVESSLVKDGSYWCQGFGELLEEIETEMSGNHNLGTQAGQFSVGPVIFYKPASGFDPDTFEYEPCKAIASDDPQGVRVVEFKANMEYPVIKEQTMTGYAQNVTGQSEMNMGRAIDRPNAPRTARQTIALLEEGDVRASLELSALREDWGEILTHIWELFQDYAPEKLFFRVTEEDAGGLFDVKDGGAYMAADERNGRYDFDLKFATSKYSKEQKKQDKLALYQIDLQNPLIVSNPRALWATLDGVHKAFGDDRFSDLVPMPPDIGLPIDPRSEYTRILQGEEVHPNPLDNDQLHLLNHNRRIEKMRADPERDEDAFRAMVEHSAEHIAQMRQKQLMAAMAAAVVDSLKQNSATGQGLTMNAPPAGLQNVQATLNDMMAGPMAGPRMPGQAQPNRPGAAAGQAA